MHQLLYPKLGHVFQNPALLDTALTHRSHSANHNERLEFLGDAILNCVIAEALYYRYEKAPEGDLSRLRSCLVQEEALCDIAKTLNLGRFLKLGYGELKTGGNERPSILADALEAIIAAIFLDSNLETSKQCILRLFHDKLTDISLSINNKDSKTQLQEYLQSRKLGLPCYEIIESTGALHQQTFKVCCTVKGLKEHAFGISTNRRKAEQAAATDFLRLLKNFK